MSGLPAALRIEGHAIVSADGMIADARGVMPAALRNDADWRLFQAALDEAALVVVGRLGHERHPNPGRRRLVPTSRVARLEADPRDRLAWLWNPTAAPLADALAELGIADGTVAVTGGRRVFDHFLPFYTGFRLSEANALVVPGGIPAFTTGHPRSVLASAGLRPSPFAALDAAAGVTLTLWSREPALGVTGHETGE